MLPAILRRGEIAILRRDDHRQAVHRPQGQLHPGVDLRAGDDREPEALHDPRDRHLELQLGETDAEAQARPGAEGDVFVRVGLGVEPSLGIEAIGIGEDGRIAMGEIVNQQNLVLDAELEPSISTACIGVRNV